MRGELLKNSRETVGKRKKLPGSGEVMKYVAITRIRDERINETTVRLQNVKFIHEISLHNAT